VDGVHRRGATDLDDLRAAARFAADLYAESGLDLRGQEFGRFYAADLTSASAVESATGTWT
jgi:alpha/beta superfamily hydrolase